MSGLALILKKMGSQVSGSDQNAGQILEKLKEEKIDVVVGHKAENISHDSDLIVVSAAIPEDNEELKAAVRLGIPVWRRSQLIGYLMRDKIGVAVAGMHGKSTTSAMIATILEEAGEDPTVLVGAEVRAIGGVAKLGKSDLLVAEACEFNRSFLDFEPTIEVITNIEEEHLDTYADLAAIKDAFQSFIDKLPSDDGLLIACLDDFNVCELVAKQTINKIGYGFKDRPEGFTGVYWQIYNYRWQENKAYFNVRVDNEDIMPEFTLSLPGNFNVLNAVAAIIVCDFLVVEPAKIAKSLKSFKGARKRFDLVGEWRGTDIIEDYGHHPTEVRSSIAAVNQFYPDRKLWMIFWPHQYSRTEQFFDDFATSFNNLDHLVIVDIYEARPTDVDKKKINSMTLTEAVKKSGVEAVYIPDYKDAVKYVKDNIKDDSVLVVQGAGPTEKIVSMFKK